MLDGVLDNPCLSCTQWTDRVVVLPQSLGRAHGRVLLIVARLFVEGRGGGLLVVRHDEDQSGERGTLDDRRKIGEESRKAKLVGKRLRTPAEHSVL